MSVSSGFARESEVAAHLAKEAGDVIMRIYATDFPVDYKAKNDPVTEADRLASRVIIEGLRREFPDDMVISEEELIPALASAPDRVWYVDPLDGTHEFIKRNGEFAVMIGLAVDGRSKVGVVFRPVTAELFWGIVRGGAWLGTKEAKRGPYGSPVKSIPPDCDWWPHALIATIEWMMCVGVSGSAKNPGLEASASKVVCSSLGRQIYTWNCPA